MNFDELFAKLNQIHGTDGWWVQTIYLSSKDLEKLKQQVLPMAPIRCSPPVPGVRINGIEFIELSWLSEGNVIVEPKPRSKFAMPERPFMYGMSGGRDVSEIRIKVDFDLAKEFEKAADRYLLALDALATAQDAELAALKEAVKACFARKVRR